MLRWFIPSIVIVRLRATWCLLRWPSNLRSASSFLSTQTRGFRNRDISAPMAPWQEFTLLYWCSGCHFTFEASGVDMQLGTRVSWAMCIGIKIAKLKDNCCMRFMAYGKAKGQEIGHSKYCVGLREWKTFKTIGKGLVRWTRWHGKLFVCEYRTFESDTEANPRHKSWLTARILRTWCLEISRQQLLIEEILLDFKSFSMKLSDISVWIAQTYILSSIIPPSQFHRRFSWWLLSSPSKS